MLSSVILTAMCILLAVGCNSESRDSNPLPIDEASSGGEQMATDAKEDGGTLPSGPDCTPQEPANDDACPCPGPPRNSECDSEDLQCSYDLTPVDRGGYLCTCRGAWRCSGPFL